MQVDQVVPRAVEAPNGKVEILGGFESNNTNAGQVGLNGGMAFAVPLGDKFGFQSDFAVTSSFGNAVYGSTAHLFTRNPNSYLLGVVGGGIWSNNSSGYYVGPEFEIYSGKVSLEGTAAVLSQNLAGVGNTTIYAKTTAAYYATPGLRFEVGAKDLAGFKTAHVGMEWQVKEAAPISFVLEGTLGDNSYAGAMAGMKFYFGGTSSTLVDRHRKLDPVNTSLELISNGGAAAFTPSSAPPAACPSGWSTAPSNYLSSAPPSGPDYAVVGGCISPTASNWFNS